MSFRGIKRLEGPAATANTSELSGLVEHTQIVDSLGELPDEPSNQDKYSLQGTGTLRTTVLKPVSILPDRLKYFKHQWEIIASGSVNCSTLNLWL